MLKGLLGILLFIFALFLLLVMLAWGFILKTIRNFRKMVRDAADLQEQRYREETGRQRQQYSQRQQNDFQGASQQTKTQTGETIIDNRHQKRENKKIFDDSDGEYVDYTEVHSS